ncbi:hypothetical protein [Demequina lignilytica]|uniref:HEAT repeat-containing protein n=1 Tax=Demequina lignilytica TaxID=3051663 RepID=A0AB35MG62_9MICO|nr:MULTISPECIES: hypothetical protein [unclassified Demequina]MDN4482737.1 hypothetical protein [Demequina sp. SYSU T0a273]MDN4490087.1 hypothetical protein [Demequina sp. SYSU T00068]
MPRIDANPQVPQRPELDATDLPHAWSGHPDTSPLRALDFWVGLHQYRAQAVAAEHVAEAAVPTEELPVMDRRQREQARAARIAELARLVPLLKELAADPRAPMRVTSATCFSILARGGQAQADREVWRILLGLSKYDDDAEVRTAADAALADLERFGTVAHAS